MTESSNNKYSAADFERYHAGKMSAAEMHALEKAAMEDPFLADALEGYAITATPVQDLGKIREKLFGEKKEDKAVPFLRRNYNWLKAAAVIIFVAGGAWLALQVRDNKKTGIAIEKQLEKTPTNIDTIEQNGLARTPLPQDSMNFPTAQAEELTAKNNKTASRQLNSGRFGTFLSATIDTLQIRPDEYAFTPAPPATITDSGKVKVEGYRNQSDVVAFNKEANNMHASNATSKMPLPGYNNTYKPAARKDSNEAEDLKKETKSRFSESDSITNLTVVLQPDNTNLKEVIVSSGKKQDTEDRSFLIKVDTLEPQEGWLKFDEYIANNIKVPDELKSKQAPYSGEVELSFEINKKGEPVNITVTKSLCSKCDEEAIRLLKEGPKWKKKKSKRGKVTIRF